MLYVNRVGAEAPSRHEKSLLLCYHHHGQRASRRVSSVLYTLSMQTVLNDRSSFNLSTLCHVEVESLSRSRDCSHWTWLRGGIFIFLQIHTLTCIGSGVQRQLILTFMTLSTCHTWGWNDEEYQDGKREERGWMSRVKFKQRYLRLLSVFIQLCKACVITSLSFRHASYARARSTTRAWSACLTLASTALLRVCAPGGAVWPLSPTRSGVNHPLSSTHPHHRHLFINALWYIIDSLLQYCLYHFEGDDLTFPSPLMN